MRKKDDIDVFENTGSHQMRFAADEFLRDAGPDHDGAPQVFPLHHLLYGDRCKDIHRNARIMTLAMAGRPLSDRIVISDARLLGGLRYIVYVRAESNYRLALAPGRDKLGRNT